jgi:hypothetical protein
VCPYLFISSSVKLKESLRFLESEAPELRGLSSYFDDEFGDIDLKIPEETVKTVKISDKKSFQQQQVDSFSDDVCIISIPYISFLSLL